MRQAIEIGGAHKAAFDNGVIELIYDGDVFGPHAAAVMRASSEYGTGMYAVWVCDLSKLGAYTPEARKVLSSKDAMVGPLQDGSTTYVYISGATIKTKAVFSLVLAATRLLGKIQVLPEFCASFEEARRVGHNKMQTLLREGKATLPR